ncbi:hypothetical protein B1M_41293, partial [Burkholderia sp. TJI49]
DQPADEAAAEHGEIRPGSVDVHRAPSPHAARTRKAHAGSEAAGRANARDGALPETGQRTEKTED